MSEKNKKGTFVVLYGNNNVGKSTQAKLLVEWFKEQGKAVHYLKYPIYDLAPSGHMVTAYLREDNPHNLSPREIQIIYALNRTQYEKQLIQLLEDGITVIAEDYTGTGIAWGMSGGVEKKFLMEVNQHLLKEDVSLFLKGQRHLVGKEEKHVHEQDDERIEKMNQIFNDLAEEFKWTRISARGSIEEVQERLRNEINDVDF